MFDKLGVLEEKFEDLNMRVSDPEIISDQSTWQKLMKEVSDLEPIVSKYREYKQTKEDIEAAKEILDTVKQELAAHLENLKEAIEEESLSTDRIGKAAHKLLPIATMMQMGCLEELKVLSPEYISEIEEAEIREKLKVVITTLSAAVSDLYAS